MTQSPKIERVPHGPLWVFAYGSLLWNPEFPIAERRIARVSGWHRSFCMRSIHHRGTEADPGLVLALDEMAGAHCDGLALRVAPGAEAETLAALRERELISSAYYETWLEADCGGGQTVTALCYVIERAHVQYCHLPLDEQAQIIATACGGRGRNCDYLFATAQKLAELGLMDADLEWLAQKVRQLQS